jgi:hypothetical protein
LLSNFPPKRYPKVADLEPPAGSGDFMHHYSDKSHSCSCRSASHPVAPVVSGILGLLPVWWRHITSDGWCLVLGCNNTLVSSNLNIL